MHVQLFFFIGLLVRRHEVVVDGRLLSSDPLAVGAGFRLRSVFTFVCPTRRDLCQ